MTGAICWGNLTGLSCPLSWEQSHLLFGGLLRRILAVAVLAASVAVVAGCAAEPPPVSEKVQRYYDENVANSKAGTTAPATPPAEGMLGGIQSAIRGSDPLVISVLGDSTGDAANEWVALWAQHLTQYGTVTLYVWNKDTNDWNAQPKTYPGSARQIVIWNGAMPGQTYMYPLERLNLIQPEKPTFTILSFGHNIAAKPADAGSIDLLAAVDAKWGAKLPAAVTLQNPAQGSREKYTAASVAALQAWLPATGYATIDVNTAFTKAGNLPALLNDEVHPNPEGSKIWVNTVIATLG